MPSRGNVIVWIDDSIKWGPWLSIEGEWNIANKFPCGVYRQIHLGNLSNDGLK